MWKKLLPLLYPSRSSNYITLTLGCSFVTETKLDYTRTIAEGLNKILVTLQQLAEC